MTPDSFDLKTLKRRDYRLSTFAFRRRFFDFQPLVHQTMANDTNRSPFRTCITGRKRQRGSWNNNVFILWTVAAACVSMSKAYSPSKAFTPSPLFSLRSSALNDWYQPTKQKENSVKEDSNDEEEHDDVGWLSWMVRGKKPHGNSEIQMREAEALGGVPRPDRYSSRYELVHLFFKLLQIFQSIL